MNLLLKGVIWTEENCLSNDMPKTIQIEVDEELFEIAKEEKNLSDFLKFEISESFVFYPLKIGTYKIL